MEIVQDGNPVLRAKTKEVSKDEFGSKGLHTILTDMEVALDGEPDGVALAAPQIGIDKRIFIVRYDRLLPPPPDGSEPRKKSVGVFINPQILRIARKRSSVDEGCLSVRGVYGTTLRHERATIEAYDENGVRFKRGGGGVLAQAFQHEIDHLNRILFIDHATNLREIKKERHEH